MGNARKKNGGSRRDLVGKPITVPGPTAFKIARELYRIGDYQFDEGREDTLLEIIADTADGSLAAAGMILTRRYFSGESAFALLDCSEEETLILLKPAQGNEDGEDPFLPRAGEIRRRVIAASGDLPLDPRGEVRHRRLVRRVYLDGDEVGELAFDEAIGFSDDDGRLRVEAIEAPGARLGDIPGLIDLIDRRMRQIVEPELFESSPIAQPNIPPPPLELPAIRAVGAEDYVGGYAVEAALLFAERGIGLLASLRGRSEPESLKIAHECVVRSRLSLEVADGILDESACRGFLKSLRRLASLLGAIGSIDNCIVRFSGKQGAAHRNGAAFAEYLHRLRGRAADDLRRHVEGERYRRFLLAYELLSGARSEAIRRDRSVGHSAPRVFGELAEELFERCGAARKKNASPRELHEALGAAKRMAFALEFMGPILGLGASSCSARLATSIEGLTRFSEFMASADVARSWLASESGPQVDAVAAAFLARNQAEAAKIVERKEPLLAALMKPRFRRDLALASYGL